MFECFKSKLTRLKKARRLAIESQRYQKITGLLGPAKDDDAQFDFAIELVRLARSRDSESCGCEVCAALRLYLRSQPK